MRRREFIAALGGTVAVWPRTTLAVMQPTRFETIVKLGAAQALGLSVPPSILLRADEVIE
jgi:hypothetical protein